MSDTLHAVVAPSEVYEAADWLRSRHPWVDQLARRITITGGGDSGDSADGNGGDDWAGGDWLDELAGAVTDCVDYAGWGIIRQGIENRPVRAPTQRGSMPGRRTAPADLRSR